MAGAKRVRKGQSIAIYRCTNCGRWEGDIAGPHCGSCGSKDEPAQYRVQIVERLV